MTCHTIKSGRGNAIVCTRGPRTRRCACGNPATKLCDFPMGNGKTCDVPMCDACAFGIGPDIDVCSHHKESADAARPPRQGSFDL